MKLMWREIEFSNLPKNEEVRKKEIYFLSVFCAARSLIAILSKMRK
jgi:hypothetical protein